MLTHAVGTHWLAIVRDVMALGYRKEDIFTTLGFAEMLAIVVAAPPLSSVRYALEGGWSREAHLMANILEQRAGIADISAPLERPGIDQRPATAPGGQAFTGESMTWEEADRLDEVRAAAAKSGNVGTTTKKVWR
ncbi:hypothetical protein [Mycolicibacterium sphagni]|uniref:hypothetical protein n=1 Tax=Mycolicibacterium sphagni TaxID=1786 RepID=UPI0021F2911C|nr:hypothetical protein [Mycolicibacterium sphagni]MCV7174940.1 hypothetical protein [Mycolicibacterium sphagni]